MSACVQKMFTTALFMIVKIGSNLEIYEKENEQQSGIFIQWNITQQ